MGDDEKKKKIKEDPRCEFICQYLLRSMGIKLDKYQKMIQSEENKELLNEFFRNPEKELVVIMLNQAGMLIPMFTFPSSPKGKCCYFIRKNTTNLTMENMSKELIYGDISSRPIDDLSILVDEVIFPILNNVQNQTGWPKVIVNSVNANIQELRNIIAEVRGNMLNRTLLPLPITIDQVLKMAPKLRSNHELCDMDIKNSLEGIIIKWCDVIKVVLDVSCDSLFNNDNHPTPSNEIDFWNARLSNLENIYDQLRGVKIRTIVMVLEEIDSFYYTTFQSTFKNVITALHETRDITLYLNPLRKIIDQFEMTDFDDTKPLIQPLLHAICLLWSNSFYYSTNFHMSNFFKMVNNMIINESSKSLDPQSIFQYEVTDALVKINTTINSILYYKNQYNKHRNSLSDYTSPNTNQPSGSIKEKSGSIKGNSDPVLIRPPKPTNPIFWTFKYEVTFERLELYRERLNDIKEIYTIANEFSKLDKVEIGGLNGKSIKRRLNEINDEFHLVFKHLRNIEYDPLDPDPKLKDFAKDMDKYREEVYILERKLAFEFNLAFNDCIAIDHTLKLIQILTTLLHQPVIFEEIKHRYDDVVKHFISELDLIKYSFDIGLANITKYNGDIEAIPVNTGFPPASGYITWIYQLRERVLKCTREFEFLDVPVFKNVEGQDVLERSETMLSILEKHEHQIFSAWCEELPPAITTNIKRTLLLRNTDLLLSVNFDFILTTALKDVKNLKLLKIANIPKSILEFSDKEAYLYDIRIRLSRIVEWYNYIRTGTVKCEFDLVSKELTGIDTKLKTAIENMDWQHIDQDYITEIYNRIRNLYDRLVHTQENKHNMIESVRSWGKNPLFTRKDPNNQGLLNNEDRNIIVEKRIQDCENTSRLITHAMDENFCLFFDIQVPEPEPPENRPGEEGGSVEAEGGVEERSVEEDPASGTSNETVTSSTPTSQHSDVQKTVLQKQLFRPYEEHVDKIVGDEITRAIRTSMRYIKCEIENVFEHNAPLFEVRCELQEPYMVFLPGLNEDDRNGFLTKFEDIVSDIFTMGFVIPRVAQSPEADRTDMNGVITVDNYLSLLDNDTETEQMNENMYQIVKSTMREALEYYQRYQKYSYLWMINRDDYLKCFLKYGRALKQDEMIMLSDPGFRPDKDVFKEQSPTLKKFSEQIDYYNKLKNKIELFEKSHDFRIWLRVNFRSFKSSLLNYVSKWSALFKKYLISQVEDGLQELENFINESVEILTLEIGKDDFEELLKILSILNQIEDRKVETDNMFDPLREIVDLLKHYEYEIDEKVANQFVELPDQWNRVKKLAMNVKQAIAPIQEYQVDLIGKRIQLFNSRMKFYRERFTTLPFFSAPCDNCYSMFDKVHEELTFMEVQYDKLVESAELFELDSPNKLQVVQCSHELLLLKTLWDLVNVIDTTIEDWKKTPWSKINVDVIDQKCKNFTKDLRTLDKDTRIWNPYTYAESKLKNLMTSLRAITELQNPAIRDRHWTELIVITNIRIEMDEKTTLSDLVALELHKFEDDVKNIVEKSVKEQVMEKALKDIKTVWKTMEFEYEVHDRTKLNLLRLSEELTEQLEDHQVQLQNMLSSKYIAYFFLEVSEWQMKLSHVDQTLSSWLEVQRKWVYLESIFIGSEDIRSQLPIDSKRFDNIDFQFKNLLEEIGKDPNIIITTSNPIILPTLTQLQGDLILCEKALNEYLETKRLAYPRFYFVSSADLLDILSNGNNPLAVCRHLTKLYDSLAKLDFDRFRGKYANEMISKENDEHVPLLESCDCSGKVEIWLNRVTDSMRQTLRNLFLKAVRAYEDKPREKLIMETAAQPALCTTQIGWTTEVKAAFDLLVEGYENALKDYNRKQIAQLNALINLLLGDLSPGDRQKIMTVCTIDVHSRDVVAKMILHKVENSSGFQWQSQLRHRWDKELGNCFANICDAEFAYDYEYLGNTPRLVITPLTDRCYITLTQSLHLIMGGAPAGPAGTGKTETTKDLGRALGIMVYVFNCSEQMDYRSCGNIYKGLSQTGAWGCFDEFNRIAVEVLSVVSVQVKSILDAIKAQKKIFNFMGEEIKLTATVGLFITMNPGYAGRTELPENLKALFRPCAMVVPDFALICEIMLVAEGFQDARLLARKFITLYTLCRELLSKQDHYDWGLRAIKSVLVVAGALKRGDRLRPEDQVLMRALRDFNIPKIVTDDVPIFMGLIGDLFPALDVPRKRDLEFENLVKRSAMDLNLQPEDGFVLKIVQLEELFAVRHSVFIVGFSGTGKTQVWKTLFKTYKNQKRKPFYNDLNPKAVTNDELFGAINASTREWKDGLFSVIMRDQVNMGGTGPKWIVLDGDIDPMWIESLNTLMDDNKVLTLASNERIALSKEMRLLFEIATLRTATPATVSRAGILYINPQDLGWNPFVLSWIDTRETPQEKALLNVLFDRYIPPLLETSKTKFKKITPISEVAMIQMTCHLLECLLIPSNIPPECPKEWYEIYFVFAVIWGFGSTLFQDQIIDWRSEFNKWWLNEFKYIKFPPQGTIFNYYIDPETKKFLPWTNLLQEFELEPDIPLQMTLVNTAETTRLRYFMDILMAKQHPLMLIGSSGSGKSVFVTDKLNSLPDRYLITNVALNFYTTSEMLQKVLEKPLEKKAGRNFGPPGTKTMIYFIDDLNMPEVDHYGTVQPHTLIRQFMDYRHWYDREKLSLKDILNCQFVSCMNPTAGSFTIDPRLQRHFCSFAVNFPGMDALHHIYFSILSQHLALPINKFEPELAKSCVAVIDTAVALHNKMGQNFLPTAIKFHYIFNLRDMANIFQGMMFATGDTCPNMQILMRLYVHEAKRVYGDKLVETADEELFKKLLKEVCKKGFESINEEKVFAEPVIFCHFAEGFADPKYMPAKDWSSLTKLLEECQSSYNEVVGAMNLVLFEDAMAHICRINRILEAPRGYALLIGVGGSGKQSLTRLACFISGLDVFQVQLKKGYSIADLRVDLAQIYLKVGIKNQPCAFLMTDSQVAEEIFLVLINDLLASGEIPDLFADDEVENIVNGIRNEVKQAGIMDTKENCWKFFIDKVRRTVKIVLCFSPVGATLRIRARKFPAVVNCTSIDWFHEWPKEALESVSRRFLSNLADLPESLTESVALFMAYVHSTVNDMSKVYLQNDKRYNYTTPKSFLELISLYSKLLTDKVAASIDRIFRLENGLVKLKSCSEQVDSLQEVLVVQEVVLKEKNDAADKLIVVVSAENEKVSKEKAFAAEEEKKVRIIEEDVSAKAKLCEEDLRKAEPALIAAQEALNTLNKNNLTELKSFGSPPPIVVSVCACVLILFTKGKIPKDRSWKSCKLLMTKVDQFLHDLVYFDKEHILPDRIKAIEPYLKDPEFNPDKVRVKSIAAAGLCAWVININKFYDVFLVVEPKQRALNEAQRELQAAQDKLTVLNDTINLLEEKYAVIQAEFDKALQEKQVYQDEADKTAFTIDLAHRLVNGLASENIRWRENVKSLHENISLLPGDVLIVSCFISYVGCFTRTYRIELQDKMWLPTFKSLNPPIPVSEASDPLELICDDAQIAAWNNEGLPSDRMSAENATILINSARWPLMIDPQLQGIKWIKQKYGDKIVVLRLTGKHYLDRIEKAIADGETLLIENIGETLDAVLDPLISRTLIKKGKCMKIGDTEIDYNPNFKLILQTKLANPHYKPEIQAQTTLINFTVTRDGLEEQLLAEVVKAERPDLEESKSNLTTQQNSFKITLKFLEADLLERLSSAGENVLEDPTLVYNLEKTKNTAAEIEIKAKEAKITAVEIDEAREHYRIAGKRAALLYFILNDLFRINPIYQFSLKSFTVVFKNAIAEAEKAETVALRVLNLIDNITYFVYLYTSRGLFESDKLIFMAQLTILIFVQEKKVSKTDLDFLLKFPYVPNLLSPLDFITHNAWGGIKALASLEDFKNLDKDIEQSSKRWRNFSNSETPEKEKFPGEWKNKSPIQKLCIMRCLRPDRMSYAISECVEEKLGKKFVTTRTMEFTKTYKETSSSTPVFFILSPGVDPLKDVEKLGRVLKFSSDHGNFYNVSLGQGQEIVAEAAMEKASELGHWVILQNVHLVAKWLSTLEKKMESTSEAAHDNYRLFISAEPAADPAYHIIPQGILESSIKITNEPPTGMMANLHKSLDNFNQDTLEMCSKEAEFKAVLFSLCYFHAVVAERRKFGAQGWNRVYPFNVGDLTICVFVLRNYLEANVRVPWEDLRYLFGEIMYGGHITDDWDRKLCRTYLEEYMQAELIDGDLFFCPGFLAPPNSDYEGYHKYIDESLPPESPSLYGLHPNAEIGFLTTMAERIFKTLFELQPRDSGTSTGIVVSREETVKIIIEDITDKLPEEYNMVEIMARVEDRTPFIIVAFQECERMNMLVRELRRSLKELFLGLKGELTITSDMELLDEALYVDKVPDNWTKLAYPSLLGLQSWFADLSIRIKELEAWAADFNLPSSVWLAGFFNPQSFLTAIMQQTARKNEWPLDKMCLNCDVTKKTKSEFTMPPREGAYVNGLYMEGARWDSKNGTIADSLLKELFPAMPVIFIKAVTQDKQDVKNVYECPVYKIRMRGPTFVWTFNLKTKERASKWTLAGVCLLLQP